MNDEEASTDQMSKVIGNLVSDPASEVANIVVDHLRYYRWRSLMKIAQKAEKLRLESGKKSEAVPLKILIPLLEEGSKEAEDSELLDTWAHLLANADANHNSFDLYCVELLGKLTHSEALLIQHCGITDIRQQVTKRLNDFLEQNFPNVANIFVKGSRSPQIQPKCLKAIIDELSNIILEYASICNCVYTVDEEKGFNFQEPHMNFEMEEQFWSLENLGLIERKSALIIINHPRLRDYVEAFEPVKIRWCSIREQFRINRQLERTAGIVLIETAVLTRVGNLFFKKINIGR